LAFLGLLSNTTSLKSFNLEWISGPNPNYEMVFHTAAGFHQNLSLAKVELRVSNYYGTLWTAHFLTSTDIIRRCKISSFVPMNTSIEMRFDIHKYYFEIFAVAGLVVFFVVGQDTKHNKGPWHVYENP
jgi:hypothetical protein